MKLTVNSFYSLLDGFKGSNYVEGMVVGFSDLSIFLLDLSKTGRQEALVQRIKLQNSECSLHEYKILRLTYNYKNCVLAEIFSHKKNKVKILLTLLLEATYHKTKAFVQANFFNAPKVTGTHVFEPYSAIQRLKMHKLLQIREK